MSRIIFVRFQAKEKDIKMLHKLSAEEDKSIFQVIRRLIKSYNDAKMLGSLEHMTTGQAIGYWYDVYNQLEDHDE